MRTPSLPMSSTVATEVFEETQSVSALTSSLEPSL